MDKNKSIALALKKERESLKYSLKHIAEKMGFPNYQTLSSIEAGERDIKERHGNWLN